MGQRTNTFSPETRYYASFTDDFEFSTQQDYQLPDDYLWIDNRTSARIKAAVSYALLKAFGYAWRRFYLHASVVGAENIKDHENGFFLFANHTQPIGDVIVPTTVAAPTRIYSIASPANLGIPFIGRVLPYAGALPTSPTISGTKKLKEAIGTRVAQGHCIVVYPEAHVWEYYTGIRPFPSTSFSFPVNLGAPTYVMTTTYQKRKEGKRPRTTIYVDGPLYPDDSLPKREQRDALRDAVYEIMRNRSKESTYEYIQYRPKLKDEEEVVNDAE